MDCWRWVSQVKTALEYLKRVELGEASFGMLKLGELGEASFEMLELGKLDEASFGGSLDSQSPGCLCFQNKITWRYSF